MRRIHPLLSLLLALLLVVTSQGMALARGHMANPVDRITICTGLGVQTIWLDANDQPVEIGHACPDCTLIGFDVAADPQGLPAVAAPRARIKAQPCGQLAGPMVRLAPPARGPPGLFLIL